VFARKLIGEEMAMRLRSEKEVEDLWREEKGLR